VTPARTYIKLVLTMFFWGGTWIAARVVVQEVAPLAAATWRFLFATASLAALVLWQYRRLPALRAREWAYVLGLGASGIFLYNVCFLYGMQHMTAGRGALVVATTPVIVTLFAAWLLAEQMTRTTALGSALALVGCLTVIGKGSPLAPLTGDIGLGEILILGCALLWATYTLIGRVAMRTISPLVATAYASAAGGAMLLSTAVASAPAGLAPDYSLRAWSAILFLGLFGTTLGFTWFAQGVQRIGAARASVFINLVPVAAVLQAALLLGERLELSVLAGGLLVLAGVALTQRSTLKVVAA
jgi:drug/metabolite transporter (DMT)-like permease